MTYPLAAKGVHHKTPYQGDHRSDRGDTSMKFWIAAIVALPFAMLSVALLPHAPVYVAVLLGAMMLAALRRLSHHPGDRWRIVQESILRAPVEGEQMDFGGAVAFKIPAGHPMSAEVAPPVKPVHQGLQQLTVRMLGPNLAAKAKDNKNMVYFLGAWLLLTILENYSAKRVEYARQIEADNDRLLGIPGAWNGYQKVER